MDRDELSKKRSEVSLKKAVAPIRLRPETKDKLEQLLAKANEKDGGRRVKPDDIIRVALGLVGEREMEAVREASVSNADRMERVLADLAKTYPGRSRDELIGILLDKASGKGSGAKSGRNSGLARPPGEAIASRKRR